MSGSALHDIVYTSQADEFAGPATPVDGAIPGGLVGSVVRNGPGLQRIGDDAFCFFDAPGMVLGVTFDGGKARVRARHVRYPFVGDEIAAGRQLKRRVFTNLPRRMGNVFNVKIADVAQHDVYAWGGKLIASGAMRHCTLDDKTLDSQAELDWGVVPKDHQMCQMPRIDPTARVLVTFSQKPGMRADELTFWELDERWTPRRAATQKMGRAPAFVHDLAFSERWFVVVENPTRLNLAAALLGKRSIYHALEWPSGARPRLWLIPRRDGVGEAFSVELPPPAVTVFHFLNAHEADGNVIVDCDAFDGPVDFIAGYPPPLRERRGLKLQQGPSASVMRYSVDVEKRALVGTRTLQRGMGELPEVHPARQGLPYRYAWLTVAEASGDEPDPNATLWTHGVCKLDVESGARSVWNAGPKRFVGQAVLAPRAGSTVEDDGWLLVFVLDGERRTTDLVILDATDPAKGPLATIDLGHAVAVPGTHATWLPDVRLD